MSRTALACACLAAALFGLTPPDVARAQDATATAPDAPAATVDRDAEARQLFQLGRDAFTDGRFEDALEYFVRSHDLSGRPQLLYNIGTAADRLQREEQALQAFEGYVAALPDAENRREVEGRIRLLRQTIETQRAEREAAAARQAESDARQPTGPATPADDDGDDIVTAWWLWTIVGAVVVGGVVAASVIATQDSYGPYYAPADHVFVAISVPIP